jgi:hypothetical protein
MGQYRNQTIGTQRKALTERPVYTENSVLGKKKLFSDDAAPISSSN